MQLESLRKVYLRPAPRLPKIIALACIIWACRKKGIPEPEYEMVPERMQPTGDNVYHLDCRGNGYRERNKAAEPETVIEDFAIEQTPEINALVQLVIDHNCRDEYVRDGQNRPRVDGQGHKMRSTRNILNRHHGSVGFLTGSGWDVIYEVSARKWQKIAGEANEQTSGPLTPNDFLRMCLHVVLSHIDAEESRRIEGESSWGAGLESKEIEKLLDMQFQSKALRAGNFQFPTLSGYIRDLYQTKYTVRDIRDMMRPWITLWHVLEACLQEAPNVPPHYRFSFGNGKGVVFDFLPVDGQEEPAGSDNPLVHQGMLSDGDDGRPRANCVLVRGRTGHIAIFCRGVIFDTVGHLAHELKAWEPHEVWTYEEGGVIFNGSKSRPDTDVTRLPIFGDPQKSIVAFAQRHLRMMAAQPIPARKYASRPTGRR